MMTQPINPYVAGAPLRGEKGFFGRQDTLEWVARELRNPSTNALVLFGQRRIGKTTLLMQLERTLPADIFLPIYFDLQDQAIRPLGQVLSDLADTVAERADWESPDPEAFDAQGRFFRRTFLPQIYQALGKSRRPVFLLDEFDVLDQAAEEELPETAAAKALFPFLRHVMAADTHPAFVFVVGRRAEDLSLDFAATFKASLVREIWVLDRRSGELLVRQAEANGTLHFTDRAMERILSLTSCHPYLTQLLCQRVWERAYSKGDLTTPPRIDVSKVETSVPDVLETGQQALSWIWDGLSLGEKIYTAALAEAADEEKIISEDKVIGVLTTHAAKLHTREVELAPRDLLKRRVLERPREREYRFAIELFRRWVRRYKPLQDVKAELDRSDPLSEQLFGAGWLVFHQSKWEDAIRYFRDALEVAPRHFRARLHLGEALLELDKFDEAVVELERAYKLDQNEARLSLARALVAQAKAHEEAGDKESALAACEQALKISPNERAARGLKAAIWIWRGNEAIEEGELDVALAAYRQAGAKGWEDAVVFVQRALERNPTLFRTRLYLSEVLLELDRTDEAMSELDAAVTTYQRVNTEPGEGAIGFFRRVLEINPNHVLARLHLGQVFLELGQTDSAITEMELAYKQDQEEVRLPLIRALVAQAHAAREAGDWLAVQGLCVRVMQIDPMEPNALKMMREAINGLQKEIAEEVPKLRAALGVNRHQLGEILSKAERQVRLLGVVALEANWQALAKKWAPKLRDNPDFEITVLCESDNILFSKAFTYDTDLAENRRSFHELQFIRDRAIIDFPDLLLGEGVPKENSKVEIEIMHLPIPVSIAQVDNKIFANLWLHEIEDYFEKITESHPWYPLLEKYISTFFDPRSGRKYACDPEDEVLELFDHERTPRGIYPRSSFYDTDFSQLVVWAFIFDRQGRLLIHRRSDNAQDNQGMWDKSVGGHTDLLDVDASRAVPREVIEELFRDELNHKADFIVSAVSDEEIIYVGEWRPDQRRRYPFHEVRAFSREWAFFRLRDTQRLYSPRRLPDGRMRRLRVIADVFLFVAGPQLTDASLGKLKNSVFKLIEVAELKDAMDKALRGEEVPGFDENEPVPKFTPDLINIMTGGLRDILEEFSQYIKSYVEQ